MIIIYIFIGLIIWLLLCSYLIRNYSWIGESSFNPIFNYKIWKKVNWFGCILGTLFLNILFLPFAIVEWCVFLCTVGRKNSKDSEEKDKI